MWEPCRTCTAGTFTPNDAVAECKSEHSTMIKSGAGVEPVPDPRSNLPYSSFVWRSGSSDFWLLGLLMSISCSLLGATPAPEIKHKRIRLGLNADSSSPGAAYICNENEAFPQWRLYAWHYFWYTIRKDASFFVTCIYIWPQYIGLNELPLLSYHYCVYDALWWH